MKRSVFLSTFLFAAVLSPITLQPYTCGPPPEQAQLAVLELRVGSFAGENTIEGFNPNVFSYDVVFPESESVGVLWVKTNHPSTMVDVEYDGLPVRLIGQSVAELDVPLGSSELAIHVTRQGVRPDAKTYIVRIRRAPVFPCTEQGIRDAIARGGGPNYFDCDGPTHVPIAAQIAIDNDVILDGEGNLIADAGGGGGAGGNGAGGGAFMAIEVAPKANGPHRVFYIPEGVTAELSGFTVTGGMTAEAGGGILNAGTLTLANSVVLGNTARFGAGIRNEGEGHADVIDTMVRENFATQAAGGISNRLEQATMSLSGCTVAGNTATGSVGGIANGGTLTMNDTTVSGNEAGGEAGGIRNNIGGTLMMTNMNVSGNTATAEGGGILNAGESSLENSTVSGNQAGEDGGGILNEGTLSLTGSAVTGNHADSGGGVNNVETGTLTVSNSTVSDNTAASFGGGIRSLGGTEVFDTIVANNTAMVAAGGISNRSGATMILTGSSVQGNTGVLRRGGIANAGTMTLQYTTVSDNATSDFGGGIGNRLGGTLTLLNSTVSGNVASFGGGISNQDTAVLTLTDTTISDNSAATEGGGVLNDDTGTLTVTDCTISNNAADVGGGVRNLEGGTLIVRDSHVSQNTAVRFGAGIHNRGQAQVVNTMVSGNQAGDSGAGLVNWPETATMMVTRTTVTGNVTATFGGGMTNTGTAELTETTISANEAALGGGGISNDGELTVRQSVVSSNSTPEDGGGIRNSDPGGINLITTTVAGNSAGTWGGGIRNFGAMNIMDTTVSNNAAQGGAGISNRPGAWMALTNSTLSGNEGGGISNWSTLTLASVTISGNHIFNDGGWIAARNTIVDSHCAATPLVDSLGGNIESPGDTCFTPHPADQVSLTPEQLNLGALQDNGGPTWTHALLPRSFAIDSVVECVNWSGFPLFLDQRGAPRPYGPACDSGAFELGAVPLPGDFCTNDADRAVYESLEYIDGVGNPSTCTDAASSIAADCVFGSPQSSPPLVGCPEEVAAVIRCFPNCSPDVIAALDQCVADCTDGATGLSTECAGCYGEWAGCGAEVCVPECAGGGMQPQCIDCLFYAGCTGRFDACSGLPGSTDCGTGGTGGVAGIPLPMVVDDYFTGRSAFGGPPDGPPLHTEDDECPQRAGEQAGDCHRFTWDGTKEGQTGDFFTGTFWTHGYGFMDLNGLPVEAGATEVQFYAWSAGGGEQILFGAGISGSDPNLPWDGAEDRKTITLTGTPTMYSVLLVNLAGYTDVYGPFLWAANNVDNPGGFEFYVDDIQWVTAVSGGFAPVVERIDWVWNQPCTFDQERTMVVTVTASDPDTDIGDLTYSGPLGDCTDITSMATTVACPPYSGLRTGTAIVTDPQGNEGNLPFAFDPCQDGSQISGGGTGGGTGGAGGA